MSVIVYYFYLSDMLHFIYKIHLLILMGVFLNINSSCKEPEPESASVSSWETIEVSASAYNSVPSQTLDNPRIAAWGDTLQPGINVIAVSRDLMFKGLRYNTPVRIDGLEGVYFVKDKMHHRWKNKIDIYMGKDVAKAKKWGRRKIKIHYLTENDSIEP
jgi:3D (Asp-Asp-Asp) domain-containing protein